MTRGMLFGWALRTGLVVFQAFAFGLHADERTDIEGGLLQDCAEASNAFNGGTFAAAASINNTVAGDSTRIYQTRFESGSWRGQLLAYSIDPKSGIVQKPLWDASALLPSWRSRQIITINSNGIAVPFQWTNLDSSRRKQLDELAETAELKLEYLRGDDSNEGVGSGNFRIRAATKLGDLIDSTPAYAGASDFNYPDDLETAAYSAFAAAKQSRAAMLYVGANDGMLHGFDANDGGEIFGFIPGSVFGHLSDLTNPNYTHRYYVDGSPNAGDAFFKGAWHTVLVGGLNGGGQGIYALDITDPNILSTAESNPASIVLWEYADRDDADLGYTFGQPAIVRLNNGKWAAVFGNGYGNTAAAIDDAHVSSTGEAALYLVDIADGSLIGKITTKTGSFSDPTGAARANGLATPVLVDLNGDRSIDYAYAGDLLGNLWKFDLRGSAPEKWGVAFQDAAGNPQALFQAKDRFGNAQPITTRPRVLRGANGSGLMVLFGTGKYLEPNDRKLSPRRDQSFYGILDANTNAAADKIAGRSDLQQQTILAETTVRVTSNNALNGKRGWYIDLVSPIAGYENEKQISEAAIRNGRVVFTTLIPDSSPCSLGGNGWLMELDAFSGSRPSEPAFDRNRDGKIDGNDLATFTLSDGAAATAAPSAVRTGRGLSTTPVIIDASTVGQSKEYQYTTDINGNIQNAVGKPGKRAFGRQSWRQIK